MNKPSVRNKAIGCYIPQSRVYNFRVHVHSNPVHRFNQNFFNIKTPKFSFISENISSDFPSFSTAYENDLPFSVRLPKANLQTEGFTINDNPRNFVAETFTRVAPPAPAEEEKEKEPSETTDAKSEKRRYKRGNTKSGH